MLEPMTLISWVLSIASPFIASYLTCYFTDRRRAEREHLNSLKRGCLEPILKQLTERVLASFSLSESTFYPDAPPKQYDSKWHEYFSFVGGSGSNPILFEDLKNHYPVLLNKLEYIENHVIREIYPKYINIRFRLLEAIYNAINEQVKENDARDVLRATFFTIVGINEDYWPNIHRTLKDKDLMNLVYDVSGKVCRAYQASIVEFKKLRNEALDYTNDAIFMIKEILQSQRLKGKCNLI